MPSPAAAADAPICAHADVWQQVSPVAERAMDGYALLEHIDGGGVADNIFGMVYANDWFVFPYTLPLGSIANVKGIALTNVFGERTSIEPVPAQGGPAWDRWSMFQLTGNDERALVLMPSTPSVLDGPPLEQAALVRGEMANLVFGIETRVPMLTGTSKPGGEAGREFLQAMQRIHGAPPARHPHPWQPFAFS